jgi:hypothetical protein
MWGDADTAIGGNRDRFPSTQLSLIEAAAGEPLAMERVVALYWKPVYRFVLPGDAPPALAAIAAKAMRQRPEDRYPDAVSVLRDIERFQDGLAVEAYAESPWQRVRRVAKRNEVLLWLLAAYAAVKFLLFFARGF